MLNEHEYKFEKYHQLLPSIVTDLINSVRFSTYSIAYENSQITQTNL